LELLAGSLDRTLTLHLRQPAVHPLRILDTPKRSGIAWLSTRFPKGFSIEKVMLGRWSQGGMSFHIVTEKHGFKRVETIGYSVVIQHGNGKQKKCVEKWR
jgi:hypothetical protein